jgi:hypothetical protein
MTAYKSLPFPPLSNGILTSKINPSTLALLDYCWLHVLAVCDAATVTVDAAVAEKGSMLMSSWAKRILVNAAYTADLIQSPPDTSNLYTQARFLTRPQLLSRVKSLHCTRKFPVYDNKLSILPLTLFAALYFKVIQCLSFQLFVCSFLHLR